MNKKGYNTFIHVLNLFLLAMATVCVLPFPFWALATGGFRFPHLTSLLLLSLVFFRLFIQHLKGDKLLYKLIFAGRVISSMGQ